MKRLQPTAPAPEAEAAPGVGVYPATAPARRREDDVMLLVLQRAQEPRSEAVFASLTDFTLSSAPGGQREAILRVMTTIADLPMPTARRESLELAVGEAVVNAMEHGNAYDPGKPVRVEVAASPERVRVAITDLGGGTGYLDTAEEPDIEAKLRGEQSPRGWGLFLVRSLVDDVHESGDSGRHTLTLEMQLGGPGAAA